MSEFRPCIKCGYEREPWYSEHEYHRFEKFRCYFYTCTFCGAQGPATAERFPDRAADFWNMGNYNDYWGEPIVGSEPQHVEIQFEA